jgi:ribosomal protein S18 acetylase RimI-like enzyme
MGDLNIRPVKESDIESIIALDSRLTGGGDHRAGFWRGLMALHVQPLEGEAPAVPFFLCHVAWITQPGESRLAGFIIGDIQSWQFGLPRHGRIVVLGVDPDLRRQGVATRLAESLLAVFRKMDLPFVHCLVEPGDPLEGLFGSLGFRAPGFRILEKSLEG